MASPNKLWVKLIKEKYFQKHSFLGAPKSSGSSIWNSMMKARDCLGAGFQFKIGNGHSSIWYDTWLTTGTISSQLPFVDIHDIHLQLKDIYVDGVWQLDMLYTQIPPDLKAKIRMLTPILVTDVADTWTWSENFTGIYSVKSTYHMLLAENDTDDNIINWSWLWKLKIPANIQFFLWQFCHNSLPTKGTLMRRHVFNSATCALCNMQDETLHHCFFNCERVREVWKICFNGKFLGPNNDFIPSTWLHDTVCRYGPLHAIILWKIWCARNKHTFEGKQFKPYEIVAQSHGLLNDVLSAFGHVVPTSRVSSGIEVTLTAPPVGWVALNVDGSALQTPMVAAFGGLIRDNNGHFLRGFYGSLGCSTIMHAELSAILHGLSMCWDMGYKKIICYSDSLNTMKLIDNADVLYHKHGNEVALVQNLLSRSWEVNIQHVFREANFCADYLAKLGTTISMPYMNLDDPPRDILQLLQADAQGCSVIRS